MKDSNIDIDVLDAMNEMCSWIERIRKNIEFLNGPSAQQYIQSEERLQEAYEVLTQRVNELVSTRTENEESNGHS